METINATRTAASSSGRGAALHGTAPEDRRALLCHEYEPIPVSGKRPLWKWQNGPITDALLSEIENAPRLADHHSTGLRTGRLSVVDVDLRDEAEIEHIRSVVFETLGYSDMLRVGSKGVAICYYNPQPRSKITVTGRRVYEDEHRPLVEFLGQGQQVVAYGTHPDTGRPYEWLCAYDNAEPMFRPLSQLTEVSSDKLARAAVAVQRALTDLGYVDVSVTGLAEAAQEASQPTGGPVPTDWLMAALASIPPSCPRDEWVRVILAVKDAVVIPDLDCEARVELLDQWSSGHLGDTDSPSSYRGYQDVKGTFDWAGNGKQRNVGIGTLWKIAASYGYSGGVPRVSLIDLAESQSEATSEVAEPVRDNRWAALSRREEGIRNMPPAKFLIPGWLRDVGVHILLANRGTGKTVVSVDVALRLATGGHWMMEETAPGYHCVYLCGEDQENTAAHIIAWCEHYNGGCIPEQFTFFTDTPDLTSAKDCGDLADHLLQHIPKGQRVVLFVDTWQRATSKAKDGQNSDRDMAQAMEYLEALGRVLGGPVVGCFHPPKADKNTTHGSAVTENASTAIWHLTRPDTDGRGSELKLEVTRIKGRGLGNYKQLRIEEVTLKKGGELGRALTGAVAVHVGGTMQSLLDHDQTEQLEREAVLATVREFASQQIRIVRSNGNGQKPKDVASAAKARLGYSLNPRRVLAILNEAEQRGVLRYVRAQRNQRVQAGFRFADETGAESFAEG